MFVYCCIFFFPKSPPPEETFAWRPSDRYTTTASATATTMTTTTSTSSTSTAAPAMPQWNGTISHFAESKSGLPPTQSATVTLLQRNRGEKRDNLVSVGF